MKSINAFSFLSLILFLSACDNPTPPPALSPQENKEPSEQTNLLKDVITSVSNLTDKISSREESLNKLMQHLTMPNTKEGLENKESNHTKANTEINYDLINLVKLKNEQAVKNAVFEISNQVKGVEKIATTLQKSLGSDDFDYLLKITKTLVPKETITHILAHVFYQSISSNSDIVKENMRRAFKKLSQSQKKQILGYALFLNSSNSQNNHKKSIVHEAKLQGISENFLGHSTGKISLLKETLDVMVTGQESAKIGLSVAIANHYKRLEQGLNKSNILIIGPSGTGKTFMVETIAKILDVPFVIADSSNITQPGYIGGKTHDAVIALAQKANFDVKAIEKGIIFFDEIDKMAARSGRSDTEEFKRQAQASLLKIIEGVEVEIPIDKYSKLTVNTKNILIVCAGAFTGLSQIINKRLESENKKTTENIYSQVSSADLIGYGIMPELLGRLPNVLTLQKLNSQDFVNILKNPRASVLNEYKNLFKLQNIDLKFTDDAILAIAEKASTYDIGARALRTVVESIMADLQFRLSTFGNVQSCTVTKRVVLFNDLPIITYQTSPQLK